MNIIFFILSVTRLGGINDAGTQSSLFFVFQDRSLVSRLKGAVKIPVNSISLIIQRIKRNKGQRLSKEFFRICTR